MRALMLSLSTLLLSTLAATEARAFTRWSTPARWALLGGPLCVSYEGGEGDLCGGVELSLARLEEDEGLFWYGVYGDAIYHSGAEALRMTIGPEVGLFLLGVDGGLLVEKQHTETRFGFAVRALFSAAVLTPYLRYGHVLTGEGHRYFESGVLFKLPMPM